MGGPADETFRSILALRGAVKRTARREGPGKINSLLMIAIENISKWYGHFQVLFADGSARFLRETLDLRVLAAICTRAGGEPLGSID